MLLILQRDARATAAPLQANGRLSGGGEVLLLSLSRRAWFRAALKERPRSRADGVKPTAGEAVIEVGLGFLFASPQRALSDAGCARGRRVAMGNVSSRRHAGVDGEDGQGAANNVASYSGVQAASTDRRHARRELSG